MPDHTQFSYLSSRQNSIFLKIALIVVLFHLGLVMIGTFWNPKPSTPKTRSKVVVQTIRLQPSQATTKKNSALPALLPSSAPVLNLEEPLIQDIIPNPLPVKKETPLQDLSLKTIEEEVKQPKPVVKEENSLTMTNTKQEIPPSSPSSVSKPAVKKEAASVSSKSKPQDSSKTADKKPAIKKPVEPAKKTEKSETTQAKAIEEVEKKQKLEAEKKRQQERTEAEKKQKLEQERAEAEKKKQQEAEKKRQQERAEAEKKRQKELAEAQEEARKREVALLTKAKENLAKMSETRDKISTSSSLNLETATIPKELESLQVDTLLKGEVENVGEWGTKEISYSDEVISRLKTALRLPDYGAVKIKLTLNRTGKVVKVETIQSESNKNKAYVESKIPTLLFPSFGQRFQDSSQNTFVITLQNDHR